MTRRALEGSVAPSGDSRRPRRRRARRLLLAALGGACLLWIFVPPPASWVEAVYSRGAYRWVAAILVPVVETVPFSLSCALVLAGVAGIVVAAVRSWRRGRAAGLHRRRVLARWVEPAAWILVVGYALFVVLWAGNYRRERLDQRLGLEVAPPKLEEARAMAERLVAAIRKDLPPDDRRDPQRALAALAVSLGRSVEEWDQSPVRIPTRVKRLPAGTLLAFGNTGVTTPLLEPHVDAGEHDIGFLAVSAHELAHAAGLCSEADADLAAAIAGLRAEDAYARYAVELHLLGAFAAALPREEAVALSSALPAAARADVEAVRAARSRYRVAQLERAQRRIYDTYLRSQGVREGIREYSFVVKLLLAADRKGLVDLR